MTDSRRFYFPAPGFCALTGLALSQVLKIELAKGLKLLWGLWTELCAERCLSGWGRQEEPACLCRGGHHFASVLPLLLPRSVVGQDVWNCRDTEATAMRLDLVSVKELV